MCQAVKSAVGWAVTNSFNVHVFNVRGLSLSATGTTGIHMFMCQIGSKLSFSLSLSLCHSSLLFFPLTPSQIANLTAIKDVHPKCQTTASERCQETEASLTLVFMPINDQHCIFMTKTTIFISLNIKCYVNIILNT